MNDTVKTRRIPDFAWRWIKVLNRRIASKYWEGNRTSALVLLLTTTGRKSGLPRVTPLQYEEVDGAYYVGSARGQKADWFRNILADPQVEVQVKQERFTAQAEPVTDPARIADFLELRLQRRPRMIGMMLRMEGLPKGFTRAQLEEFCDEKALVILHPC